MLTQHDQCCYKKRLGQKKDKEGKPRKDTRRRLIHQQTKKRNLRRCQPVASQSQTSDLQKHENVNFCELSHQVWVSEWVKSLSRVWLFATPWTAAYQAPPSMRFSRQEYWSGLPFPSPPSLGTYYKSLWKLLKLLDGVKDAYWCANIFSYNLWPWVGCG